jgi:hypothetical protein
MARKLEHISNTPQYKQATKLSDLIKSALEILCGDESWCLLKTPMALGENARQN